MFEAIDRRPPPVVANRPDTAGPAEREFLARLIESSLDCIKVLELSGQIRWISSVGLRLLEVDDPQSLAGRLWIDFWRGDTRARAEAAVAAAAAGRVTAFEGFCPTRRGTPKWWDVRITPIFGAGGQPEALLAVSRDVTEQKHLVEQLQASHDSLEALVAERTAGLDRLTARLRFALAAGALRTWTWSPEGDGEAICVQSHQAEADRLVFEGSADDFLAIVHVEDRSVMSRAMADVRSGSDALRVECRIRFPAEPECHALMEGRRDLRANTLAGVFIDLTARRVAEEERRQWVRQLIAAAEAERRRIARALHDETGQHLTALSLGLETLRQRAPDASAVLERLAAVVDIMSGDVRRLISDMRLAAKEGVDLSAAIREQIAAWSATSGVAVDFCGVRVNGPLPSEVEIAALRIVQEALNNVAKHAAAGRVAVILERRASDLLVIVEDNGRGFAQEAPGGDRGFGLIGMRERAALLGGGLTIESSPGAGTVLRAVLPVPPELGP